MGKLVSGAVAKAGKVDPQALYNALMTKFPSDLKIPNLGQEMVTGIKDFSSLDKNGVDGNAPKNGLELIMTTYGTYGYRYPFIYLPADMNGIKNRILSGKRAISEGEIEDNIALALDQVTGAPYAHFLMTGLYKVGRPSHFKYKLLC